MPDSRIGRIHHPILEAGILVLLARCARSHRCRRPKARRRLKREPLNGKWRKGECLTFLHFFLSNLLPPLPSFQSLHMQLWRGSRELYGTKRVNAMEKRLILFACPCTLFLLPAIPRPTTNNH